MKLYLLAAALVLVSACGKHNDVDVLEHEATVLAKFYQPKIEQLETRAGDIMKRGREIPGNLPGIKEVGERLQEATDKLTQLRGIVGSPGDQKSALEKMADEAAKKNVTELRKLIHDTETMLANGTTMIQANLRSVESWIANYDRQVLAFGQQGAQPGTPETVGTPATGQPPAATQPPPHP